MKVDVVDVAGNMEEEFVQAVLTVHTYILTCVWNNGFYIGSSCVHHLYILTYVCMYVQSTLPVQIETTGST